MPLSFVAAFLITRSGFETGQTFLEQSFLNANPQNERDTEEFFEDLYSQLRSIACRQLQKLPNGQTLRPTEIVHEAFQKLHGNEGWQSEGHFLNTAAKAMRQLLVDRARKRLSQKRGGEVAKLEFLDDRIVVNENDERLLEIHEALDALAEKDERAAKLVELTFFLGMNQIEAAEAVGISERTARRDLVFAQAWLARKLEGE